MSIHTCRVFIVFNFLELSKQIQNKMTSYQHTLKCLSIWTPKTINFLFGTNGKLMVLGVPVFEHISVKCNVRQFYGNTVCVH